MTTTNQNTSPEVKAEMLETMAKMLQTFDEKDLRILLAFMRGLAN